MADTRIPSSSARSQPQGHVVPPGRADAPLKGARLLAKPRAAAYLSVSERTLVTLPIARIRVSARRVAWDIKDLDAYIERQRRQP